MGNRFDALAKALAESSSRRDALRRIAGAAAAAVLASVGVSCDPGGVAGPRAGSVRALFGAGTGRCKKLAHKCRQNSECCSGFCDPFTGVCACSAGNVVCPATDQCIPACEPGFTLNAVTCQCECLGELCGDGPLCCIEGTTCVSCPPFLNVRALCCPSGQRCLEGPDLVAVCG
jgi:hypothetical protein